MIRTDSIEQFDTAIDGTFAFRIKGELTRDDLEVMAEALNNVFDRREEIDLLISFRTDEAAQLSSGLSMESVKAQFRAVTKVRNYCIAYAPDSAKKIIEIFDGILPVKARTFASEHNALEHLRAQPPVEKAAA